MRSSSSYESQIAELQRRLHEAIVQIEVANKEQNEKDLKLQQQVYCLNRCIYMYNSFWLSFSGKKSVSSRKRGEKAKTRTGRIKKG